MGVGIEITFLCTLVLQL